MAQARVYLIEDDPVYGRLMTHTLQEDPENEVHVFTNGQAALQAMPQHPDIVVLDYNLPDTNGSEVMRRIHAFDQTIDCVVLSNQREIRVALDLLKQGAYDYIVKDEEATQRLLNTIQNLKKQRALCQKVQELQESLADRFRTDSLLLGQSEPILRVMRLIDKAAGTNLTVSIQGETGTGKEVVARAIHFNSPRKAQPFVALNVAAVPAELIESELFGHEKGAFTGAIAQRRGKFEMADKGTLFLDEIGEMELPMQAKLLRVLQEQEFTRVGGEKSVRVNTRIIVATHRNLAEEVKKGRFREDLYYRLLGMPLVLPPLRERGGDVLLLARHFLDEFAEDNGMSRLKLGQDAREKLLNYSWPGNIRELKAAMELAAVMANQDTIGAEDITLQYLRQEDEFLDQELTLHEYNRRIVRRFLKKYNHNVLEVAKKLGIGKSTLYRMIKEDPSLNVREG